MQKRADSDANYYERTAIHEKAKIQNTRPGCFCAKDCPDSEKMYIHGGILSLLLVVVGCSGLCYIGLYLAVLGCTGLYLAALGCTWLFWNVVDCTVLHWTVLGYTGRWRAVLGRRQSFAKHIYTQSSMMTLVFSLHDTCFQVQTNYTFEEVVAEGKSYVENINNDDKFSFLPRS